VSPCGEVQRWKKVAAEAQDNSEALHRDKTEREQIRRAFADLQAGAHTRSLFSST